MLRQIIAHPATLAEAYSFIHHVLFIMSYLYQKVCCHIRMLPLKVKRAMEAIKKRKRKEKKQKRKRKRKKKNKEKGGSITIFYPHLCSCLAPTFHMREFSCFTSITMWGIYIIELGLYIPMISFLKSALGLREQPSWMHPHQFHWRYFIHIQLYVHPLHGNHYSLHSFDYKTSSCLMITYSFVRLSSIGLPNPH